MQNSSSSSPDASPSAAAHASSGAAAHIFDQAVALESIGPDLFRGHPHEAWANMVGPFGGTTAATMLNAVLQHPDKHGDPLALTLNYAGPIGDGPFQIEARPSRTNNSNQHWWIEMRQGDEVVTTATAITGRRRETWSETESRAPAAPPPEELPTASEDRGVRWISNYDMRFVVGGWDDVAEGEGAPESTTTMWIRDRPERDLDYLALASMCDSFFPRAFLRLGRPVPAGTVTLTIHFLATADEIAAQGSDFLLGSIHSHRFHGNYHDEAARLWSRDGTLLATGTQLMYFKG